MRIISHNNAANNLQNYFMINIFKTLVLLTLQLAMKKFLSTCRPILKS